MSQSATESLEHVLLKVGHNHTYHGWDIIYEMLKLLSAVGLSVFVAELIAAYPGAKVVLNYREDVDFWHHSASKTLTRASSDSALFLLFCLDRECF